MSAQNMREVSVTSYYEVYLGRQIDIKQLLSEVVAMLQQLPLTRDDASLSAAVSEVHRLFPFVRLVYLLDERGRQISNNITVVQDRRIRIDRVCGQDRSQRPYFDEAVSGIIITEPYISLADGEVCISVSFQSPQPFDTSTRVVVDCNLTEVMSFLASDMF